MPDTHPQCAGAARSTVLKDSDVVMLIGARLNWLLSHGKGKAWGEAPKKFIQIDIEPKEMDSNVEIVAPVVGDIGSCVSALLQGMGGNWPAPPADWPAAVTKKREENVSKMAPRLMNNNSPMDYHGALVRSVPRRGIYVVRKTKREVIEMITAWAALESMAARLITQNASADEIAGLRRMFTTFENGKVRAHLDEYSDVNIEFHQAIIRLSHNRVLIDLAENLFTHMRMIRRKTIGEKDRADRSIRDHMNIIEALEARATDRAEELVRDHALGLAEHVARFADYLD